MSERGPAWFEHPHSKASSKAYNCLVESKDHGLYIDYSWFYSPQLYLSLANCGEKLRQIDAVSRTRGSPRLNSKEQDMASPSTLVEVHDALHSRKSFLALHSSGTPCTSVLHLVLEIDCPCLGKWGSTFRLPPPLAFRTRSICTLRRLCSLHRSLFCHCSAESQDTLAIMSRSVQCCLFVKLCAR